MRNFKVEDFEGCGQYLVRASDDQNIVNTSFLTTVTYKVAYQYRGPRNVHTIYLMSMADGLVFDGYLKKDKYSYFDSTKTKSSPEEAKRKLVKYLNDPKKCKQEMRFATQEEIVRVVMHQHFRWRNKQ